MSPKRPKEVNPVKGLSLDPEVFPFTLKRLKALAALRNIGYQTLLKEFVVERLYEEEKRRGIIDA